MYIRTQDRENLIPIDNLVVTLKSEHKMAYFDDRPPMIKCSNIRIVAHPKENYNNNDYILGLYQTKDRAMKILDEIQKILQFCFSCNISSSSEIPNYKDGIYIMPEE